jgi:hypothetical protein
MIAILLFGLIEGVQQVGVDKLKNETAENPGKAFVGLLLYNEGLNGVTPAFRYDIPEAVPILGGEYTYMINDIPLPDGIDMIIIIPALIAWFGVLKALKKKMSAGAWLIFALLVTPIFLVLMWVITKFIWLLLFYIGAKMLGMTAAQATAVRENTLVRLAEIIYIMTLIAIVSVVAASKIIYELIKGNG